MRKPVMDDFPTCETCGDKLDSHNHTQCYGCYLDSLVPKDYQSKEEYVWSSATGLRTATKHPKTGVPILDMPSAIRSQDIANRLDKERSILTSAPIQKDMSIKLTHKQAKVYSLRQQGLSLPQIAEIMGVTKQAISLYLKATEKKLRGLGNNPGGQSRFAVRRRRMRPCDPMVLDSIEDGISNAERRELQEYHLQGIDG